MPVDAGTAVVNVVANLKPFMAQMAVASRSAAAGQMGTALKTAAAGGALALGAAGAASVKFAVDFDGAMRNVNSIAQLGEKQFHALEDSVLALSGETAQSPQVLAEGLYDLVSSGFNSKQAMVVLEASAKAASAGLTTTEVSAKAVAGVLNAYRLPASKASEVSDTLFRTVDRGVITFEELSSTIGKTLPIASQLGIPMNDLGASIATLTKQSFSGAEANTAIRGTMVQLLKGTTGLDAAYKKLGVSSGEQLIKQRGFQGALEALSRVSGGSAKAMGEMFTNSRALAGAMALTGKNTEAAEEDLKAFADTSGATNKALSEQSKSVAFQWKQLSANLQAMAIEIGRVLLPVLSVIVEFLNQTLRPAFNAIKTYVGPVLSFIDSKIGIVKIAIAGMVAVLSPFTVMLLAVKRIGPPVFEALKSAAMSAFNFIKGAAQAVGSVLRAIWGPIKAVALAAFNVIKGAARVWFNVLKALTAPLRGFYAGVFSSIKRIAEVAFRGIAAAARLAFGIMRSIAGAVRGFVVGAFNTMKGAASALFGLVRSAGQTAFGALKSVISALRGAAIPVFNAIKSAISAVIGVVRQAVNVVRDLIDTVGGALDAVGDLASKVGSLPGKALDLLPGLQHGGPLMAGEAAIVGEAGPEIFVPNRSGTVIPNRALQPQSLGAAEGPVAITITNWETGQGYMRTQAERGISQERRHIERLRRMSR